MSGINSKLDSKYSLLAFFDTYPLYVRDRDGADMGGGTVSTGLGASHSLLPDYFVSLSSTFSTNPKLGVSVFIRFLLSVSADTLMGSFGLCHSNS